MTVVDIFLQVVASFFTLISICVCFKLVSFVRYFLYGFCFSHFVKEIFPKLMPLRYIYTGF